MATRAHAPGQTSFAPHLSLSTSAPPVTLTPQARRTFQDSFAKFEKTVIKRSKDDQREFADTTLRDVWEAVREIEQQLAARQHLRNLKRLEPFLNGLDAYSKVVEVLCNGTPYMPWIWAPIKLMIKLASDHISAFETLISAYAQIAENLPRFDRLSNAFRNHPDFQQLIAVVYSDILEFHRQAYKFFRRSGWKSFFKSSWGQFDSRFSSILTSMQRHASLVDKEASAYSISEIMMWRREAREAAVKVENERSAAKLAATLSWLGIENLPGCGQSYQDNTLNRLSDDCCPGTTDWTSKHPKTKVWLQDGRGPSFLWLKGKPGSGKSTIVARIAQSLRSYTVHRRRTLLCCFYGYSISSIHSEPVMFILATLVSQILRQNIKLCTYVYEEFVAAARSPSTRELQKILSDLIPQLESPRILIDGIDECIHYGNDGSPRDLAPVKDVLQAILQLEHYGSGISSPKILLASRDIFQITEKLSKKPVLSLDDESEIMTNAIRCFAKQGFREIQERFESLPNAQSILSQVESRIVSRSQGMFLWVRLVLSYLEQDAYSMDDLEKAAANLPVTLNEFYGRILARLDLLNTVARNRAISAINWMLCARRPLRAVELQDAIVFAMGSETLTERNKLSVTVLNHCKPLIQIHSDGHVSFVHFTVQEFFNNSSFTNPLNSERCVAVSCLRYLNHSLTLSPQNSIGKSAAVDTGKCLHILQPYVYEHWLDHLLSLAVKCHDTYDGQLEELLSRLLATINHHQKQEGRLFSQLSTQDHEAILSMEPRLLYMRRYGYIFQAIVDIVQHRHVRALKFHDTSSLDSLIDPTPFSMIKAEYEAHVNELLSASSFPGLSSVELAMFHRVYQPFALVCRYPGCANISAGFATHTDRDRHEKSHAPPLSCIYSGCKYALPFNSLQSLKRHIRESHDGALRRIPKTVRSQRNQDASFSSHLVRRHEDTEIRTQNDMAGHHRPSTSIVGTQPGDFVVDWADKQDTSSNNSHGPASELTSVLSTFLESLLVNQVSWPFRRGHVSTISSSINLDLIWKKFSKSGYFSLDGLVIDLCKMFQEYRSLVSPKTSIDRGVLKAVVDLENYMWMLIRQMQPYGMFNPRGLQQSEPWFRSTAREDIDRPTSMSFSPKQPYSFWSPFAPTQSETIATTIHMENSSAHDFMKAALSSPPVVNPIDSPREDLQLRSLALRRSMSQMHDPHTNSLAPAFIRSYREKGSDMGLASKWNQNLSPEERGMAASHCYMSLCSLLGTNTSVISQAFEIEVDAFVQASSKDDYFDKIAQELIKREALQEQQLPKEEVKSGNKEIPDNYPHNDPDKESLEFNWPDLFDVSGAPPQFTEMEIPVPGAPPPWPDLSRSPSPNLGQ